MNKIPNNIDSPLIKIYFFPYTTSLKKKNRPLHQKRKRKRKKKKGSQLIRTKHHELLELGIGSISRLHIKAKI